MKSVRESFSRLKHREETLSNEVEKFKLKVSESNERIREREEKIK